jgi:simple sugar transport system ATP-binding protein
MQGAGPFLEVKNISKSFGTVRALRNVSFDLAKGRILGFVGDNGAGRTTLLNILSGSLLPSDGEIFIEGKRARFRSPADAMRMGIAIVYQSLELVDIAKVWENFFMGRELTTRIGPLALLDIQKMKHATAGSLAKYGQTFSTEREIGELSGGQRQIVAVTRAVEANPEILLLDEPTHGLSKRVIRDIFDLLQRAREEKNTSIIITAQWYEQVSDFIDEVIVLRRGEIAGRCEAESADKVKIFKLAMGLAT